MQMSLPLVLLAGLSLAEAAITLTSNGCVDTLGFEQCAKAASDMASACISKADSDRSQTETIACGCAQYQANYNCYVTHCWNRVWECEYQEYLVEYLKQCPIAKTPLPYFPIPDNVQDSCSCNVGKIYNAFIDAIDKSNTCISKAGAGSNAFTTMEACKCCMVSETLSTIYGTCPTTNQDLVGLTIVENQEKLYNMNFNECASLLSKYNCVSDLGFSSVPGDKYLGPNDIPAKGTNSLTNGAGTVTAPASGTVFTYTDLANKSVYTVTAASAGSGGRSGSKTTGGSDSGAGPTVQSSASGGQASQTTSSKNSGVSVMARKGLVASGLVVSLFMLDIA